MHKIKIVRKYVSKSEIAKVKAYQRKMARNESRLVLKVEAVDACEFFRTNKNAAKVLFKNWAHPQVGDYIVIVHYCMDVFLPNEKGCMKEKIKKAVKEGRESKVFFPVRLDEKKREMIAAVALNYTTNFSIPAYMFKHYSTITRKKRARFEIPRPIANYRLAA